MAQLNKLRLGDPVGSYQQGQQFRRMQQQQDTQAGYAEEQNQRAAQQAEMTEQLNQIELELRQDKKVRAQKTERAQKTASEMLSMLEASPDQQAKLWPQIYQGLDPQAKEKFPNGQWDPTVAKHVVKAGMSFLDRVKQINAEEAAQSKSKDAESKDKRKGEHEMSKLEKEYELKKDLEKTKATEKAKAEGGGGKPTNKQKDFEYLVKSQNMDPELAAKRIWGSGVRVITNMTGGASVVDLDTNEVVGEMSMTGEYTKKDKEAEQAPDNSVKSWLDRKFGSK